MAFGAARPKVYLWVFTLQNSIEELNVSREKTRAKNKESRE
jgi:hypothetical protein